MLKHRLVVLVVLAACVARAARPGARSAKGRRRRGRATGTRRSRTSPKAVQEDPDNAEYKISLERAMQSAARDHISRAHELETKDQLDARAARVQARRSRWTRRTGSPQSRAAELERTIRDRIEKTPPEAADRRAARSRRGRGRSRCSIRRTAIRCGITFNNSSLRDVLRLHRRARPASTSVRSAVLHGRGRHGAARRRDARAGAAADHCRRTGYFYKVLNPKHDHRRPGQRRRSTRSTTSWSCACSTCRTRTPTEMSQMLNTVMRIPACRSQPAILPNKTANTITVRAHGAGGRRHRRGSSGRTTSRAPRSSSTCRSSRSIATRTKQYGLNLSNYALGLMFSPEVAPPNTRGAADPADRAAAVQPEHDQPGHQHGGLLPDACRPRSCASSRPTRTRS